MNQSFNIKNIKNIMVHGNAAIIKQTGPKLVYSVVQWKALELMAIVEEKCPIAQRDGFSTSEALNWTDLVQDTVYQIMSTHPVNTKQPIILSLQKADGSCCSV